MHTERASGQWTVRFVRLHGRRSRDHLFPAEPTIEAFLTDLAVHGHAAAPIQNQAMHALGCLDTRVLNHAMQGRIPAGRADKKLNVPVVMTREEVAAVLSPMDGTAHLVATRLYGSGWRLMEAVRLRGTDFDDQMTPRTVRSGQGGQERCTTVPAILTPWLQHHLAGVKTRPQPDLAQGQGAVYLPQALARKSPPRAKAWGWP